MYRALYERTEWARGRARDHLCVDCSDRAADWSQIHGTPGREPADFEARCRSCHALYDGKTKLTEARVRGIRASVGATQAELAEIHGVHPAHVSRVLNRAAWKQIR